jgi:hypothetical protein
VLGARTWRSARPASLSASGANSSSSSSASSAPVGSSLPRTRSRPWRKPSAASATGKRAKCCRGCPSANARALRVQGAPMDRRAQRPERLGRPGHRIVALIKISPEEMTRQASWWP